MNARGDRGIDFNIERKIRSWADGQKNQRDRDRDRQRERERERDIQTEKEKKK